MLKIINHKINYYKLIKNWIKLGGGGEGQAGHSQVFTKIQNKITFGWFLAFKFLKIKFRDKGAVHIGQFSDNSCKS